VRKVFDPLTEMAQSKESIDADLEGMQQIEPEDLNEDGEATEEQIVERLKAS